MIHYTAMSDARAALDRLCDPGAEVSAHYLIGVDGKLWQMVDETMRAWHAGAGEWNGQDDINSRSIGIELDNTGAHPFSEPQMAALERLLSEILTRWEIAPTGVIGHSDMAPGRKCDPGPRFDWTRLARQGLARECRVGTAAPEIGTFRALAQSCGFTADVPEEALLEAIRLRLRPWALGPLERDDMAALAGFSSGS
ncbi:N-acetylmuramoyl-L-alanine amidase [Seohaeicola saemankumensis]|nr:N-acetylmuramoyl-L-alanine amidase [Seohaeicola saemankumensis]